MLKHVFVTGASGFVGRHFGRLLQSRPDWKLLPAPDEFDLRDAAGVARTIAAAPGLDAVLHLAAQSSVPQAFADPRATLDINFLGTLTLLNALKAANFHGRFIYVGTADAYGVVPENELPVGEDRPLRPRNPYAVSKAAAEALVYQWTQSEGLNAVLVRPFNHIGPGQDERFAVAAFARQFAEMALGRRPMRLEVGDLDVSRDFTDVRDVARAYGELLTRGAPGSVYNIGSGSETRLRDVVGTLGVLAGVEPDIVVDNARLRPAEQRRMVADTRRIRQALNWQPHYRLEQTLGDIYTDWKERLTHE
jgi:GDP-4-dehydro-6-deoxy-D-mannose reductase